MKKIFTNGMTMISNDTRKSKKKKGNKPLRNKPMANSDPEEELMDLMEEYGDEDTELEADVDEALSHDPLEDDLHGRKSRHKKGTKDHKHKGKAHRPKDEYEPTKPKKSKKSKSKKRPKGDVGKPKGKPKRKPGKPRKKPTHARKIAITGKAHKLPIEEADENVEIDWADEEPSEEDRALSDFELQQMDYQIKYIEREKMNLANELIFIRNDLDQKTKLVDQVKSDNEKLRQDFEKYKKRVRGEIKEKQKYASEKLINELLEILDNFDRTNNIDFKTVDKEDLMKGIQIIHNQLLDVLQKDGLSSIKAAKEPFDPYIHEAVSTTHTDDYPNNTILEVLQEGYKYKGKVVRPSKVRVSQSDIRPAIPIKRETKKKKKEKEKKDLKKGKKEKPKKEKLKEKEQVKEGIKKEKRKPPSKKHKREELRRKPKLEEVSIDLRKEEPGKITKVKKRDLEKKHKKKKIRIDQKRLSEKHKKTKLSKKKYK